MCGRLDYYIDTFSILTVECLDATPARSFPPGCFWCSVLMIAVIDAIDSKIVTRNFIPPSEKLEQIYKDYTLMREDIIIQQPSIAIPFWHLQFSTFWELRWRHSQLPETHITTIEQLRDHVYGAILSEELFPLLLMPSSRRKLKRALIHSYLPDRLST